MFVECESGAVTVDWVVLTAGLVGLGLATMAVVSIGVQDTSNDIDDALNNQIIYSAFGMTNAETFTNGSGLWSGVGTTTLANGDALLGPIGGSGGLEQVTRTFNVPNDSEYAKLTFDFYAMDSLDSEGGAHGTDTAHLYIGGQLVATGLPNTDTSAMEWTFEDVAGIDVYAQEVIVDQNIGGSSMWSDDKHEIIVVVQNPGETVDFGFGSNANQGSGDESYAIDNVVFEASGIDNYPDI